MKILYVYADNPGEWNCSHWRCVIPARAINTTHKHQAHTMSVADFASGTPICEYECGWADLLVVQRNIFGSALGGIKYWREQGKTVVVDFDDAYNHITPDNASFQFWGEGIFAGQDGKTYKMEPSPLKQFETGLKLADAFTAPSRVLIDDWTYACDGHYLPNYIEHECFASIVPAKRDTINIGWGGSVSHFSSWEKSGLLGAIERLAKDRPQIKVILNGSDRRIFEAVPVLPEQKEQHEWVRYAEWPQELARYDIGIAPLAGEYDKRRSWIKVLEYMAAALPWVASDYPAYSELRKYGTLVTNSADDWYAALLHAVDNIDELREKAKMGRLFAKANSASSNVDEILEVYKRIQHRKKLWQP